MISEELSDKIHALVEHLRATDDAHVRLVDVASVTEVLIGTMQAYFRSIDTRVYREFAEISEAIEKTRKEISQLQPKDLERIHIPRAGQELDAIVQATESATETIMEAAEEIMAVDGIDAQAEAACMRIFEACSFQDITGQRISKVVETLNQIEERIARFKSLWGVEDADNEGAESGAPIGRLDGDVRLEGPALEGEGIDQSAVDALMGEKAEPEAAAAEAGPAAEPAVEAAPDSQPDADAKPEAEPEPEAESEPQPASAEDKPAAEVPRGKAAAARKKPAAKKPATAKKPAKAKKSAADKKPATPKKADTAAKPDDAADAETAKTAAPKAAENKPAAADAAPAKETAAPAADDQSDGEGEEATQDEIDALFA